TRVTGPFGGWELTGTGRAADTERITAELDASGARPVVARVYDGFLPLNRELLDLCTTWQLRPADGSHDSRVLNVLADFHRRADEAVCRDLSAVLHRFSRYRVRLSTALVRAKAGEHQYVVDDLAAYHTVWFQLHEDMLATLGLERT
ncbi:transcriptional regulator, partial [Actinomadura adrarensis]